MTREEAIDIMGVIVHMLDKDYDTEQVEEALDMAIQALSQEPKTQMVDKSNFDIEQYKMDLQGAYDCGFEAGKKAEQEPCDDVISREAVKELIKCGVSTDTYDDVEQVCKWIDALPSVTQKSGKWDRLYSWLNDMRLGIAPDETVEDIDERHCRESQTDILDEIMEWMIKAEGR